MKQNNITSVPSGYKSEIGDRLDAYVLFRNMQEMYGLVLGNTQAPIISYFEKIDWQARLEGSGKYDYGSRRSELPEGEALRSLAMEMRKYGYDDQYKTQLLRFVFQYLSKVVAQCDIEKIHKATAGLSLLPICLWEGDMYQYIKEYDQTLRQMISDLGVSDDNVTIHAYMYSILLDWNQSTADDLKALCGKILILPDDKCFGFAFLKAQHGMQSIQTGDSFILGDLDFSKIEGALIQKVSSSGLMEGRKQEIYRDIVRSVFLRFVSSKNGDIQGFFVFAKKILIDSSSLLEQDRMYILGLIKTHHQDNMS